MFREKQTNKKNLYACSVLIQALQAIFDPQLVESADMEPTDIEPTDMKGQMYVSNLTMSSPNCVILDTSKTTFRPQTMSPIPT